VSAEAMERWLLKFSEVLRMLLAIERKSKSRDICVRPRELLEPRIV